MHAHTRSHARSYTRVRTLTHALTHTRSHALTHMYAHTHAHTRSHAHTHTHSHTHAHARTLFRCTQLSFFWMNFVVSSNRGTDIRPYPQDSSGFYHTAQIWHKSASEYSCMRTSMHVFLVKKKSWQSRNREHQETWFPATAEPLDLCTGSISSQWLATAVVFQSSRESQGYKSTLLSLLMKGHFNSAILVQPLEWDIILMMYQSPQHLILSLQPQQFQALTLHLEISLTCSSHIPQSLQHTSHSGFCIRAPVFSFIPSSSPYMS